MYVRFETCNEAANIDVIYDNSSGKPCMFKNNHWIDLNTIASDLRLIGLGENSKKLFIDLAPGYEIPGCQTTTTNIEKSF